MGIAIVLETTCAEARGFVRTCAKGHACIEVDDGCVVGCFDVVALPKWDPVKLAVAPWFNELFVGVLPVGIDNLG